MGCIFLFLGRLCSEITGRRTIFMHLWAFSLWTKENIIKWLYNDCTSHLFICPPLQWTHKWFSLLNDLYINNFIHVSNILPAEKALCRKHGTCIFLSQLLYIFCTARQKLSGFSSCFQYLMKVDHVELWYIPKIIHSKESCDGLDLWSWALLACIIFGNMSST